MTISPSCIAKPPDLRPVPLLRSLRRSIVFAFSAGLRCEEHCLTQGGQAVAQELAECRRGFFPCHCFGVFEEAVA